MVGDGQDVDPVGLGGKQDRADRCRAVMASGTVDVQVSLDERQRLWRIPSGYRRKIRFAILIGFGIPGLYQFSRLCVTNQAMNGSLRQGNGRLNVPGCVGIGSRQPGIQAVPRLSNGLEAGQPQQRQR